MAETLKNIQVTVNGTSQQFDNPQIASDFSTSTAYAIGKYVTYQGQTYRFTAAKTAGAWDSTKVTAVNLAGDTDTTLSIAGMAADAKATGDNFAETVMNRGQLTSSDNLNNVVSPGTWFISANNVPTNWPFGSDPGRFVIFASSGSNLYTKVQLAVRVSDRRVKIRCGTNTTTWSGWTDIAVAGDLAYDVQPYEALVTASVASANGWTSIEDLPSNRLYQVYSDLPSSFGLADNSDMSSLYVFHANQKDTTSSWRKVFFQSVGDQVYVKNGLSDWNTLMTNDAIDALSRSEKYAPAITWEQGGFTTSTWTKMSSSSSYYPKYIRFVDHPSLKGVARVRVEIEGDYKVYFACRGWSSAINFTSSRTVELTDADRTELNLTVCTTPSMTNISPSAGSHVTVTFIPETAALHDDFDQILAELDGVIISNESAPVRIGLYGASIVAGEGVTDFVSNKSDEYVDMSEIGYSNSFYKYGGSLSWAAQFEAYIEATYSNVTVENWGVRGATSSSYYDYLSKSLANSNSPLNTNVDIAIIMMGNNGRGDTMANNIAGFEKIINLFLSVGAKVFFLTPTAAFNGSYALNTYQIMQCTKIAAHNAGVASVDGFHWIEDYCDLAGVSLDYDAQAEKNFLNSDRLHPSNLGHTIIFKAIRSLLKV